MTSGRFSFGDASEICIAPYAAQEQGRDAARQAADRAEAHRCAGVAWSGLGAAPPRPPRTSEAIRAAAEAALARAETFAQSPRGQFLHSLQALQQQGYAAPAETARAAFARGFADPDRPACPAEIGAALAALGRLDQPESRRACLALTELLMGEMRLAAE
ncbi:hypothetical protein LJR225_002658 [Phenylobacterium sp. LjRoot225]|uniref:hypothetical protein n=1 Tax=Phenylobacterium sp. LjRoot225 TaxID=3342285 RepID=UPI003ECEB33B